MTAERELSFGNGSRRFFRISARTSFASPRAWVTAYLTRVSWSDAVVVTVAVLAAQIFGARHAAREINGGFSAASQLIDDRSTRVPQP